MKLILINLFKDDETLFTFLNVSFRFFTNVY